MKKFFTLIFTLCVLVVSANAQDTYANYSMNYFNDSYLVDISDDKIFMEIEGERESYFLIKREDVWMYQLSLKTMKSKYVEYKNIAIENNITSIDKDMFAPPTGIISGIAWMGAKAYIDLNPFLNGRFKVLDGKYLYIISGRAVAEDNEYIDNKYYFVISSEEEFDTLISIFDESNINAYLDSLKKVEELFN